MIIQLYDSFGILEIDSLQLWFRPCYPDLIYPMGIHSSASSIFGKVEVSTVIGQWPGSTSIMFYLRVLPLISQRCLAIAPHLTNFVEVMFFVVVITLRVLGCYQPRTPTSEIILHYKSNTPSIFTRKYGTQSGHS